MEGRGSKREREKERERERERRKGQRKQREEGKEIKKGAALSDLSEKLVFRLPKWQV